MRIVEDGVGRDLTQEEQKEYTRISQLIHEGEKTTEERLTALEKQGEKILRILETLL